MPKQKDFDYKKAAADLEDVGAYEPDEIYRRKTKKSIDSYLRENDLNPKKYYKSNNKNSGSGSSAGCYLTSACVEAKGLPDDCQELQTLRRSEIPTLPIRPADRKKLRNITGLHRRLWKQSTCCPMQTKCGIPSMQSWCSLVLKGFTQGN